MGKIQDELKSYTKTVLDHFENPRNVGSMSDPTLVVTAENPACRDFVKLFLRIDRERVVDVRVKIMGCTVAIAATSMLGELIKGKPVSELAAITQDHLVRALGGLPEHKIRCTGAALAALKNVALPPKK